MSDDPNPLTVVHARRSFGDVVALDDVDLGLGDGELLVLVGPSGCGKSTLLRSIAGLVALDSGRVEVGGTTVDDGRRSLPPEQRSVGLVFQEHALFPHLTIGANVAFGLRGRDRAAKSAQIADLLDMVEIRHLADRYPHEVSGGERQRASVARAVAPRPALLLLDEPFASLDPNLRRSVRSSLVALLRDTGTPAVFVSHDQAEALALGDRVAVMRAGRIEQIGSGPEVFARPANRFVAAFMGDAAFLPVERVDGGWRCELGPVGDGARRSAERTSDKAMVAVVRPCDVRIDPVGSDAGVAVDRSGAPGVVVSAEYEGPTWRYAVRLASGATVWATDDRSRRLAVGDTVAARMDGTASCAVVDEAHLDHDVKYD